MKTGFLGSETIQIRCYQNKTITWRFAISPGRILEVSVMKLEERLSQFARVVLFRVQAAGLDHLAGGFFDVASIPCLKIIYRRSQRAQRRGF